MSDPIFDFDDRSLRQRLDDALARAARHRRAFWMAGVVVLLCLIGAAAWDGPARGVDLYHARSGDTLKWTPRACLLSKIGLSCLARRLRLFGVDAFETGQTCRDATGKVWPCGAAATRRLQQLAEQRGFSCNPDSHLIDRHARDFAVCSIDGQDVGALLVSEGLAFYYGRGLQYLPLEEKAKQDRRGAWAGRFIRPQFWREGARLEG